jgi:hypothetical protein
LDNQKSKLKDTSAPRLKNNQGQISRLSSLSIHFHLSYAIIVVQERPSEHQQNALADLVKVHAWLQFSFSKQKSIH